MQGARQEARSSSSHAHEQTPVSAHPFFPEVTKRPAQTFPSTNISQHVVLLLPFSANPPVVPPGPCHDFGTALRNAERFSSTEVQERRSAELYPVTPEQELKAIYPLPPLSKKRKALSGKALAAFFNYCFMQHPKKKKIVFSALSHIKEVIESK